MIKAFKRWLAKAVYEELQHSKEEIRTSKLYDILAESGATIVVFQIDNGFLVGTMNRPGFTYCADHQAIADYLISSTMKDKLGVQSDMFEKEKQAAQRQYASNILRGEVAAQPRI